MSYQNNQIQIHLHAKEITTLSGSTLAVFSQAGADKDKSAKISHPVVAKSLSEAVADKIISGTALEAVLFRESQIAGFKNIISIGLGAVTKMNHETVRQAAAALYKEAKSGKQKEVFVHIDGLSANKKVLPNYLKAFVEGLSLASYSFDELKSKSEKKSEPIQFHLVTKGGKEKSFTSAFHDGLVLSSSVNFAKRLGDLPGNYMTPTIMADEVVKAAKGSALKVTVWDKKRIEKEKMGGLLGVAQGSAQEPRFIIMEYKGAAASKKPVAFVGKGLTFDSGGISLKPGAKMEEMKYDMMGGAAVIGSMLALSQMKAKVNAIAFVAATENMPGSRATKPGDVHHARNGKTFEINNTDAEGRLILSDALCYASEQKPQIIIDAATLTGAMVVALGNIHTGFFTRNSALKNKVEKSAESSGELVWHMPLTDYHVKDIKGTFADFSNISYSGGAGSATAAAFLEQFVDSDIPWAHFDIAGTGWACGNRLNYCTPKGGTGVMIRTFVEIAKSYF